MTTLVNSSVALAHMCHRVLNALDNLPISERSLLLRAKRAFEMDSVEAARLQLAQVAHDAYLTETREVYPLFLELHDELSSFSGHLGPLMKVEDRRASFRDFKAWLNMPLPGDSRAKAAA